MNLSLDELAEIVHKSKSSLSKYESGSVVLDVDTLFDIAMALHVPVEKLLDYKEPSIRESAPFTARGFFNRAGLYYMYHLEASANQIVRSVIEVKYPMDDEETLTAVFYNHVVDYQNLYNCHFYYSGEMVISDLYTNFTFYNQVNAAEQVFIVVVNSLKNEYFTTGLVVGISSTYLVPVAYKAIFSHIQLEEEEMIRQTLQFSKEDLSLIRKNSALLLASALPIFTKQK